MVAADSDTLCVHGLWMPPADLSELSGLSHVFSDLSFAFWKQKDVDEPKKNKGWNILKGVCWSGAQTSAHIQKFSISLVASYTIRNGPHYIYRDLGSIGSETYQQRCWHVSHHARDLAPMLFGIQK